MKNSFSKVQYLLFALLMFALAGCGANTAAVGQNANTQKLTAKTVGLLSDNVKTVRLKVTGATIPTATQDFAGTTGGTLDVYPGNNLIVTAMALDSTGAVLFEGFATDVAVTAGTPTNVSIALTAPVVKAADTACIACHDATRDVNKQNLVANYKQSGHYSNTAPSVSPMTGAPQVGCAGCHGPSHNILNPATSGRCADCHTSINPNHTGYTGGAINTCGNCHTAHNFKLSLDDCVACHALPQNAGAAFVQDNNGVRAITSEFAKWSHHVTGVTLNSAHCAACHLEGKAVDGNIVLDRTVHTTNATTHLRNADTDADFAWNPAAPNHSGMDTFCMSCHDANGANSVGSKAIQAVINAKGLNAAGKTASPSNPFGDTISNRYDKMQRPAVINVNNQFDTANASHHAVKGKRYTGRTVTTGDAREIADAAGLQATATAIPALTGTRSTIYDNLNPLTGLLNAKGAVAFNQLYVPLADAAGETNVTKSLSGRTGSLPLGDDSTLHCGDCHTVGQFKAGSATNMDGSATTAAIGAHGSQNEYMLRNTNGSDARHTQNTYTVAANVVTNTNQNGALLICFNCHAFQKYGSAFNANAGSSHGGEYPGTNRCNGQGNTLSFNGYTTGTATSGLMQYINRIEGEPAVLAAGESSPDMSNIFGIQCANCHNSGLDNGYGGIHGSAVNTYKDGMGNTTKHMRFMPGLGNVMYVPGTLGGIPGATAAFRNGSSAAGGTYLTGGVSNDTNWEQRAGSMSTGANVGAGCYTLGNFTEEDGTIQKPYPTVGPKYATQDIKGLSVNGGATIPNAVNTWGGCYDHAATPGGGTGQTKAIIRPVTY
jgi:hypothetical protein